MSSAQDCCYKVGAYVVRSLAAAGKDGCDALAEL